MMRLICKTPNILVENIVFEYKTIRHEQAVQNDETTDKLYGRDAKDVEVIGYTMHQHLGLLSGQAMRTKKWVAMTFPELT